MKRRLRYRVAELQQNYAIVSRQQPLWAAILRVVKNNLKGKKSYIIKSYIIKP